MDELHQELEKIKERNRRVEADKAWEVSTFRAVLIGVLTFVFTYLILFTVEQENALFGGLLAGLGFFISTLSIPIVKRWWLKTFWKEK